MDFKDRKLNLSVPSVRDIEAPLGGTSTVYEIVLVEGDEQFTYTRTFREIEDFARKLQKKFTSEIFPALHTGADVEVKRQAAQTFLKFISDKPNIISSNITQQFMGQDRSVKHIVKDRNQNSTAPTATVNSDLYEDLFQESAYQLNKKQSNLFDDDSCELFYSETEKILPTANTREPEKSLEEPTDPPEGQDAFTSDNDEVDQLFVPRKGPPLTASNIYDETEDLFVIDDNLNDLLSTVSARVDVAKVKGSSASNSERSTEPSSSTSVPPTSQPKNTGQDGTIPDKPSLPVKPVLPTKPPLSSKPVLKPKPAHLQTKPKAQVQSDHDNPAPQGTTKSKLNTDDIGSYIVAAEKDTLCQVKLFDD